jgi:hypothetical protein
MKPLRLTVLVVIATLFTFGCAGMPQTADEFRKDLPGSMFGKLETYEVNRSVADIGKTFQKYAPKCLNVRVEYIPGDNSRAVYTVTKYTPTVIVGKDKTELHLQYIHEKGPIAVYKIPPVGYYLIVVDAIAISKNKSRIELYHPTVGHDTLIKAIKNWTKGENLGCPDMTQ